MRLHALSIDAFGPFVDAQRIDFDELGGDGVFLIHGPTGAGKTSILDAVCFALFADVPGARASRGLRADLAPSERPTQVTLEFTSSGRRLRVTRSPEYVRPKRRGTGLAKSPARVVLEELVGGTWRAHSTRIDEAADVIKDVVGMGLAQFQRVAMLPQGQFADFLRADARARHELLTALFDVRAYADVETWLADQRRDRAERVRRDEHDLSFHVRALTDLVSGLPAQILDEDAEALMAAGPADWAGAGPALLDRLRDAATQALGDAERLESQVAEHQARHVEAVRVSGLLGRARAAQAGLASLDEAGGEVDRLRVRLAEATAADRVRGELATWTSANTRLRRCRAAADAALATVTGLLAGPLSHADPVATAPGSDPTGPGLVGTAPAWDLSALADRLAATEPSLSDARDLASGIGIALEQHAQARCAFTRADAARGTAAAAMDTEVEQAATRRAELEELRGIAGGLEPARARRRALAHRIELISALGTQRQAAGRLAADLITAREGLVGARERLLDQQQLRLADLAGELAARLSEDHPCPVCGSADHPAPAPPAAGWSPEVLAAAEAEVEQARLVTERIGAQLHAAEAVCTQLRSQLAAVAEPAVTADDSELEAQVPVLRGLLRAATGAERDADHATAALPAAASAAEASAARATEAGAGDASAEATRTAAEEAVARAVDRVVELRSELVRAVDSHRQACPCGGASAPDTPPLSSDLRSTPVRARATDGLRVAAAASVPGDWIASPESGGAVSGDSPTPEQVLDAPGSHVVDPAELIADVAALARRHAALVRAVERAAVDVTRADEAASDAGAASVVLDRALAGSPFPDADAVAAALRPAVDSDAMRSRIEDHDRQRAVHMATLAEPDVAAAQQLPRSPAVEDAAQSLAAAREAAQRADRAGRELDRIANTAQAAVARLLATAGAVLAARTELAEIAALAELTAGTSPDNTLRMRLSTFVLASRLERVVAIANERLQHMGEGRFQLEHDDSLAGRGARSGLGLRVRDEWSGTTRAPASLSGGESFMASVALALGLADTLRESAGGVELQTLFIDEGFGALDDASLDDVLGVLDSLRDGGRAVGVVSHVPELRDRIAAQLAVTKSQTGSALAPAGLRAS